jgi:saccharopine dehydrogenase (NAD+, L-lysine-forming)
MIIKMGRALIIGCGGVASVVIHKCCQNSDVFEEIMIASEPSQNVMHLKKSLMEEKQLFILLRLMQTIRIDLLH